jgi:hypothetical protein
MRSSERLRIQNLAGALAADVVAYIFSVGQHRVRLYSNKDCARNCDGVETVGTSSLAESDHLKFLWPF